MTENRLHPIPTSTLIEAVTITHAGLCPAGGSIGYEQLGLTPRDAGFRAVLTEKPKCVMFCANTISGRKIGEGICRGCLFDSRSNTCEAGIERRNL